MIKVFLVFLSLFILMLTTLLDGAKAHNNPKNGKSCDRYIPSTDQSSFSPLVHLTSCEN